eukprot:COSAG02_NODE_17078_length_1030_cov_1.174006_1_plen_136_part_00
MFDNEFTLIRDSDAGWEGFAEVVGFVHYHNTITIPNEESWIIQGRVDPSTSLPVKLDARLKTGTALVRSHASVVLRSLRMSGQTAPVDTNGIGRDGLANFGGVNIVRLDHTVLWNDSCCCFYVRTNAWVWRGVRV